MKNIFTFKRSTGILASGIIVTTGIVTILSSFNNFYYQFDGQTFSSKAALNQYINNNKTVKSRTDYNDYYLYNNKTYDSNSYDQVTKDVANNSPITEYDTYQNPYKYITDSNNQLSPNVLSGDNDHLINVYQGSNGLAYKSQDEAINSFHDYHKVYRLADLNGGNNTKEFDNQAEAKNELLTNVQDQIKQQKKTAYYEMSGLKLTKDQVNSWIKSTTTSEYDYNGYHWSSWDQPDVDKLQLTQQDENQYIQKYQKLNQAYWLNINSQGLWGTFSGSQYIETNSSIDSFKNQLNNGWKEISSQKVNALLAQFSAFSGLVNLGMNTFAPEEDHGWDIDQDFFNQCGKDGKKKFRDYFYTANGKEWENIEEGANTSFNFILINKKLNQITGMSRWQKTLVFLEDLYNYTIMLNHSGQEQAALDFINLIKDMLKQIIINNTGFDEDMVASLFKNQTSLDSAKQLTLIDVIHLFLNPQQFSYESPSAKFQGFDNFIERVQNFGDGIFGDLSKLQYAIRGGKDAIATGEALKTSMAAFEKYFDKVHKTYVIDGQTLTAQQLFNKIKGSITANIQFDAHGLVSHLPISNSMASATEKLAARFVGGFNIAQDIWTIGDILSPIKYVTYANDFGNGQILYYKTMELSFLGIDVYHQKFAGNVNPIQVFEKAGITNDTNADLYVVLGSLYNGQKNARHYLKEYILQHPNQFGVSTFYINILSHQEKQEYKSDPKNPQSTTEQLEMFVNKLFEKYFALKEKEEYYDGISEYFEDFQAALDSFYKKTSDNLIKPSYKFTDQLGISHYYDSEAALKKDYYQFVRNYKINSKTILASDLIKTDSYKELDNNLGTKNKVYGITFDGEKHYFLTYDAAQFYLLSHSNITFHHDEIINYYVIFKNQFFTSEAEFNQWVSEHTKIVPKESGV